MGSFPVRARGISKMIIIEVNFMLVVLVAVIASMALRYAWFSDHAFGTEWLKLAHVSKSALAKDASNRMMITCFAYFAMATTLFTLLNWTGTKTAADGFLVGVWIGGGVAGMSLLLPFLWEGRNIRLFLITAGHQLASIVLMCALMAYMIGKYSVR